MFESLFELCWDAAGGHFERFLMPVCVFVGRCQGFWGHRQCVSTGKGRIEIGRALQLVEVGERREEGMKALQELVLSGRQSFPMQIPPQWPPGAES